MEETGFGVFEDKVVKNYIATEFLFDYLKDKRSVGVISEDPERGIQEVAEPIGVVLALTPITNPTSTVLFKAIVAAKTRNAIVFRPSARAARCAQRAVELLQEAGEAAGLPPNALQVVPDPTLDVSQYLFHHPGVDFIWTTGGPKAVAAANQAGKPCISVGPGNAPVYIHASADVSMAVVDMLISKTFDASVICPAEQTCVIDDAVWDETVGELQRMGARLLRATRSTSSRRSPSRPTAASRLQALGQSCLNLGSMAGFETVERDKVLLAPLPSEIGELERRPGWRSSSPRSAGSGASSTLSRSTVSKPAMAPRLTPNCPSACSWTLPVRCEGDPRTACRPRRSSAGALPCAGARRRFRPRRRRRSRRAARPGRSPTRRRSSKSACRPRPSHVGAAWM